MQLGNYKFDPVFAMDIAYAVGVLIVTWIVAKIVKWTVAKLIDNVSFLQRSSSSGATIGESLGKIVSGLVWLFGLLIFLGVLGLDKVTAPLQTLLNDVAGFVPNLIGGGLIFFVGLMVARIVRDLVITVLETVDFDKWANKGGVDNVTGNSAISKTIGTIVFALVIIPVSIAALEQLQIASVSGPASDMLRMIFAAIPNIIGAALLLGIGYVISKFVATIVEEVLPGLGVDRAIGSMGLLPDGTTVSSIISRIAQIAIMIVVAIAATNLLGFPQLTSLLNEILTLGGKVIFGAVVIGFGFLIANLLSKVIGGAEEGSTASTIVKWATIILFTFMGLNYTGVGEIITETAFSAIVIGMSVAGALAFGLGGRDWAAKQLEKISVTDVGNPAKPTPTKKAAPKKTAAKK